MRLTERIHLVGSGSSGLYLTDAYDTHAFLVVSEADLTGADLFEATLDDGALTDVQRRQVRRLPKGDRPDAHPNSTTGTQLVHP